MPSNRIAAVLGTALVAFGASAAAQEFTKPDQCVPGMKVAHRNGSVGTMVGYESHGLCRVQLADGQVERWMFSMTRPAGAGTQTADKLVVGKYPCYTGSNYLFMDLVIRSADGYEDGKGSRGTYRLDPATQKITFASGPFKDMHGKLLPGPRVGLNANGSNFYNTTCSLAK